MKIITTPIQNQQNYRIYNNSLNRRCAATFGGKIYSNRNLDELLKSSYFSDHITKSQKFRQRFAPCRRIKEALNSKTVEEKKVFERELLARAMELYPELKNYRMEEYKKYYNQNEFRPPSGKIGLLKQDASDYANKKLLQLLIGSENG